MSSNYRACFAVFTGFPSANSRFLTLAFTLPPPPLPTPLASDWQATRSNQSSGSPPSLRAAGQWRRPEGGANANVLAGETQRFIHSSFSSFSPHSERGELPRRLSYTRRSPTEPERQTLCRENSPRRAQGRGKAFGFLRSFLFSPPSSSQGYRVSTRCFLRCFKRVKSACQNVPGVLSMSSCGVWSEETAWFFFPLVQPHQNLNHSTPNSISVVVPHLFLPNNNNN